MFASLFVLLYLGHLLADYPLQSDHQATHKADRTTTGWVAALTHAATHVATCAAALTVGALVLDDVALSLPVVAAALVWIGASHAFIDRRWPVLWWMRNTGSTAWIAHGGAAHVDQTAHVLAVGLAALALSA
ncbi:DUF3307 domain-containing protein [Streptomyces rhizosphaericola]|uniref:DUF3307 domain-containing protein n=1 Tax=Streptomyces rhizosphaericola TaxID=2564098 RepID=A0ABY2PGT4_9ACTN|nr:DUF3307 domain-containing protein [Streptomyces rhizosphaericola]TGZ10264.1 DUF3307 domain-containing protein [Streptomyces rhizosphaericola]